MPIQKSESVTIVDTTEESPWLEHAISRVGVLIRDMWGRRDARIDIVFSETRGVEIRGHVLDNQIQREIDV